MAGARWRNIIKQYKIRIEKIAQDNIYSIYFYILYNLCNPIAAINYMENIKNKINSLNLFPYRGAIYTNYFNRFIIHKKYLIFYEIQENKKEVIIKRILHSNVNKDTLFY